MNNQYILLKKLEKIQLDIKEQVLCSIEGCEEILTPTPIEQGQDDPEVALYCKKCKKIYFLNNDNIKEIETVIL